MLLIKSQPFPEEMRQGEEILGMLQDVDGFKDQTLAEFRRFALWHAQLSRFTQKECRAFVGHSDFLLKQRRANQRKEQS